MTKVIKEKSIRQSSTDIDMLVESESEEDVYEWDRSKIVASLIEETGIDEDKANDIAISVENKIISLNIPTITTSLLREFVNNELLVRKETRRLKKYQSIEMPISDIEQFVSSKSTVNANINTNNPEAVSHFISEYINKKYAFRKVFSSEVVKAHMGNRIYLHDLGMVNRYYCFGGNIIEYIKKHGLCEFENMNTKSKPSNHIETLLGQINTFLSIMQANFAGAMGLGFVNIFFAPMLVGLSSKGHYDVAQDFIFNLSQNCFSRGAQTMFIDLNLYFGVPETLKDVPAVGKGGKYMIEMSWNDNDKKHTHIFYSDVPEINKSEIKDEFEELKKNNDEEPKLKRIPFPNDINDKNVNFKVMKYSDFEKEAQQFLDAVLQLYEEGDGQGNFFFFPKIDLHITNETFSDTKQKYLLNKACKTTSVNGTPYFVFDRDSSILSACCRLKSEMDTETLQRMQKQPESFRFCALQNVSINLPQCAYRSNGDWDKFLSEIKKCMDIALLAHEQKARFIRKLEKPGSPLQAVGKIWKDGYKWVDLDKTTRIFGIVGLDNAMRALFGKGLEDRITYKKGLQTIAHMYKITQEFEKMSGFSCKLEETPGESLCYRAAKIDLQKWGDKSVVNGDNETGGVFYVNSCHYTPDSSVSLIERIVGQSAFHLMVKSGSIVHAFCGECLPNPESLFSLLQKINDKTACDQFCVSPEFTKCTKCNKSFVGKKTQCEYCGSPEVDIISRVTGYFSITRNWNKGKQAELLSRNSGQYNVVQKCSVSNIVTT